MKILSLLAGSLTCLVLASCGDVKKLQYLQGPLDSNSYKQLNYQEPVIQAGDILSILVFSDNAKASAVYNQASAGNVAIGTEGAASTAAPPSSGAGYLVGADGTIQFPGLGNLMVQGLTREQLAADLAKRLEEFLGKPFCQIRYLNFKVTVLGEVKQPSVFTLPAERVNILEALGMAGDLTDFARRDSIMVIRQNGNERNLGWLDLRKTDIFNSEFFYLKQNDVVVVHQTRKKSAQNDQLIARNISIGLSIVSTIAILLNVLTR